MSDLSDPSDSSEKINRDNEKPIQTMRMNGLKIIMGCAFAAILAACGTNEANYKKAYDKAKEKDSGGIESTIYNRVREQSREERIVTGGDTVNVTVEYVTASKNAGFTPDRLHKYNVVTGQFKQLFHAKSMRNRMEAGGYPQAIIVETGEPLYYVVIRSTPSLAEAKSAADSISASSPVRLKDGFPVILRASNR